MKHAKRDLDTLQYLKKLRLLCVEDNKTTQVLYGSIFEDLVNDVVYAFNGKEGFEKFNEFDIDIIISDYNMPEMNGLDMIKRIRELDKNVPIIFVSAIEEIQVIVKAIESDVSSFIQKPIQNNEIVKALENASKLVIANDILQEQAEKAQYTSYQEDLGFSKELNILRNDFYYQMIDAQEVYLLDFLYHPLDILSGDAYCVRRIDKNTTFYMMLDGMGKGISASLTAMIMTSFVNHIVDKMIAMDSFELSVVVYESMEYIKPVLLDEEALSIDYIMINNDDNILYYAKFAMPVLLMENYNSELIRLKSNNSSLSKWQHTFNIDSYDISEVKKFLIYTDGIVENETIYDARPYSDFLEEDFVNSFTREDLKNSFFQKISEQDDDISLVYIHKMIEDNKEIIHKSFATKLEIIEEANVWYENVWKGITDNSSIIDKAGLVFTELFMNAYEHGNLGINSAMKHRLLENDNYIETLQEKEILCNKKIIIKVNKIKHQSCQYIITHIMDEGEGFDTQILSEIFRNSTTFNGRGVFVSRKNSLGIYYNAKGNSVLFLHKV